MPSMTAPPFDGVFFDTIDDLMNAIQHHAKQEGWAIVKVRACNRRADGQYYRYDLECDRGTKTRPNIALGRRKVSSRKEECTWRGRAVAFKSDDNRWKYLTLNSVHNHPPSLDPSVHPMHRRRTREDHNVIQCHTQAGSRLHTIAIDLREDRPEIKRKDIINDRAKLRREAAGPYTQTQLFLKALQDSGEFFRICRGPDNRIIGVFWTFPWCKAMVKNYPDVLSMDNTYNVRLLLYLMSQFFVYLLTFNLYSLDKSVPNATVRSHWNNTSEDRFPCGICYCQLRVRRSLYMVGSPTTRPSIR